VNDVLVSGPLADALDVVSLVLLILGGVLSLAAGVGLLRFPDPLARMHAATKPQILGVILVLLALALQSQSISTAVMLVPVLLFQMLTAPISAHMVGRAGYRLRHFLREDLLVDELEEAIDRAHDELRAADGPCPGRRAPTPATTTTTTTPTRPPFPAASAEAIRSAQRPARPSPRAGTAPREDLNSIHA
jgi:multicomponent Na+:H+ antiporter subunit G